MHSFENWQILLGYFPVTTCYNCYSWGIFSQVMCLAQLWQEQIFDGLQAPIPSRKQLWQVKINQYNFMVLVVCDYASVTDTNMTRKTEKSCDLSLVVLFGTVGLSL